MQAVVNDVVKMEWDKAGWLQKKGKNNKPGEFIFASKDYESTKYGTLTVFFTDAEVFVWCTDYKGSEQDFWNASELKDWCKDNLDGAFPAMYSEYVNLMGVDYCNMAVLEYLGLEAHKEDIEKRAADIAPYGNEVETTL